MAGYAREPRSRPGAHERMLERRRQTLRALGAAALIGLIAGIAVGVGAHPDVTTVANRFARSWQASDYRAMYRTLTPAARRAISYAAFEHAYTSAAATATERSLGVGHAHAAGPGAAFPVAVRTRIFGTIKGSVTVPVTDGEIAWRPYLAFPGLTRGLVLSRRTQAPPRAAILAEDGTTIASGPAATRSVPAGSPAAGIVGRVGTPTDAAQSAAVFAAGFPPNAKVGVSGLEATLDDHLRGTPGGVLRAGSKVLARSRPRPAPPLRSSISLPIQAAAEQALGGRFGGIAALDPRTGEVRALAGIAVTSQPPGSTFKIITATAALEAGAVNLSTHFPVQTQATIEGVPLQNAGGEACGGSFANAFAQSCNSVFAPLGVKLGASRLVATAERFGFNEPPPFPGAAPSTIPPAGQVGSPLAVGSTAIGQGKVLATALEMATAAATIASGGMRRAPTLLESPSPPTRATSAAVAAQVEQLMLGVVEHGTGTAASLAPVKVAGKTGTAELGTTVARAPSEQSASGDTDAWFAAYAPVPGAKIAVGAMFVKAGAGGAVAAPAARGVLQAGLKLP